MGYVYLIKNGDLFKIGRTENLERRLKQLSPGKLVYAGQTDRSRDLEYELHKRFKSVRIPQTEYFRLNASQVDQVKSALGWKETRSTQSHAYKNQTHVHNRSNKSQEYKNKISDQNDWYEQERIKREKLYKKLEEEKLKELAQRKYDKHKKKLIKKMETTRKAQANESPPKTANASIKDKDTRIRLAAERAEAIMREHRKSPMVKMFDKTLNYFVSFIRSVIKKVFP